MRLPGLLPDCPREDLWRLFYKSGDRLSCQQYHKIGIVSTVAGAPQAASPAETGHTCHPKTGSRHGVLARQSAVFAPKHKKTAEQKLAASWPHDREPDRTRSDTERRAKKCNSNFTRNSRRIYIGFDFADLCCVY